MQKKGSYRIRCAGLVLLGSFIIKLCWLVYFE